MRAVFVEDYVTVSRTGQCSKHAHSLEELDCRKRPSHFQDLAAVQVASGYLVADVARNLRAEDRPADRKALLLCSYRLEEAAASLPEQARGSLFARWITTLGKATGPT